MSPDAPAPTFDSKGNLVAEWWVRIGYDAVRDCLNVTWHQDAGPYSKAAHLDETLPPDDLEGALRTLQTRVRIMGARRLF